MMPYYDGTKQRYWSDTFKRSFEMTEEEAEEFQVKYPNADLVSDTELSPPLPNAAGDDYLECTCQPDPPNGTAPLCPACRAFFESLLED